MSCLPKKQRVVTSDIRATRVVQLTVQDSNINFRREMRLENHLQEPSIDVSERCSKRFKSRVSRMPASFAVQIASQLDRRLHTLYIRSL